MRILGWFRGEARSVSAARHEMFLRVILGLFFLLAGVGHALSFDTTVSGAGILTSDPQVAMVLAGGASALLILGGLSLILGFYTRVGALMLLFFLVPATRIHALIMEIAANGASILSVSADDQALQSIETLRNIAMQGHQANVMKNIVLAVVVFTILGRGAGPLSLDAKARK